MTKETRPPTDVDVDGSGRWSKIDRILNVYGLQDPQPSIVIIETIKKMKRGEIIKIIGSKPTMQNMQKTLLKQKKFSVLECQKHGHAYCIIKINEVPTPS